MEGAGPPPPIRSKQREPRRSGRRPLLFLLSIRGIRSKAALGARGGHRNDERNVVVATDAFAPMLSA